MSLPTNSGYGFGALNGGMRSRQTACRLVGELEARGLTIVKVQKEVEVAATIKKLTPDQLKALFAVLTAKGSYAPPVGDKLANYRRLVKYEYLNEVGGVYSITDAGRWRLTDPKKLGG